MAQTYLVRRTEKTVPRAFWTLKTAGKQLAGYAISGAFRDDPGVDSSCRLYSKKQQDIVLKHEFFTIYMVLVYHIYIAVLLAIREQYSYNRIVLA